MGLTPLSHKNSVVSKPRQRGGHGLKTGRSALGGGGGGEEEEEEDAIAFCRVPLHCADLRSFISQKNMACHLIFNINFVPHKHSTHPELNNCLLTVRP